MLSPFPENHKAWSTGHRLMLKKALWLYSCKKLYKPVILMSYISLRNVVLNYGKLLGLFFLF